MAIHIGKLIGKKLNEAGITKSEFGRRIKVSPQSANYILKKQSLDTEILLKISVALDYDFFQHYLGIKESEHSDQLVNQSMPELKREIDEINHEINTLELHNSYLREIVDLLGPLKQVNVSRQKLKKR